MNKKIFNLPKPDPQGKQINYKNILIAIAPLLFFLLQVSKIIKTKERKKELQIPAELKNLKLSLQQKRCRRLLIQTL